MVDDSKRREVARRLRGLDYADLQESLICAYLDALGIEGYADWVGIAHRLADLIDPGELKTTCIAEVKIEGEKLDEVVNRAIAEYTGIDRDALLALAEEAKKCAWYFGLNHDNDELKDRLEEAAADFSDFAKRIREVLEVTE